MGKVNETRLRRVKILAALRAEKAQEQLARITKRAKHIKCELRLLDDEMQTILAQCREPFGEKLALDYVSFLRKRRYDLVAELAHVEIERKIAFGQAQTEEGRRIAVTRLFDQAS